MLIGYARVSTETQDLALQLDALKDAGYARTFKDTASGVLRSRPQLDACFDHLRAGDTLVVWRLDRLGRSLRHLLETITELENIDVGFRSLTEGIETTSAAGRMTFHVFGALAEFERSLIRERTVAGLEAARARGRTGGRPSRMNEDKIAAALAMRSQGRPMHAIARALGVSRATLYRHLGSEAGPGVVVERHLVDAVGHRRLNSERAGEQARAAL